MLPTSKTQLYGAIMALLTSAVSVLGQGNTPPTISDVPNQFIEMNTSTATLDVTIDDAWTPASKLVLTAWSTNPVVTPLGSIVLGGTGPNRTITVTPAPNQAEMNNIITLMVTDASGLSATSSFVLNVTNPGNANLAPVISTIPNQVIPQNTDTGLLAFIVSDAEVLPPGLTVTAASSNTKLVPLSGIQIAGKGSARTVKVVPALNQVGTANITLTVFDGSLRTSATFSVTVVPVPNTRPTITQPANRIVMAGSAPAVVSFTIGDAQTAVGSLIVSAKSSNSALLPASNVVLGGGTGRNRTVTLTPVQGQTGAATITLTVSDGKFSVSVQFLFAVHDPSLPTNSFTRPTGIFSLDSSAGTTYKRADGVTISLRDANIRNKTWVDGYALRVAWDSIEMAQGVYDFKIIDNIVNKLPKTQRLSIILTPADPSYIAKAPGVTTWADQSTNPPTTRAVPWDPFLRARRDAFLQALAAHIVPGGGTFANWARLSVINPYLPGGFTGVRDPVSLPLKNMPGYTRAKFLGAVQDELRNLTARFPAKFVQIGFWNITDNENANYDGVAAWTYIRLQLLAEFDGTQKPRVGFYQENLAASRQSWGIDPVDARPRTIGIAQALYESQPRTWNSFQMLDSWIAPFDYSHLENILYGTVGEGMEYGFNSFGSRYFEIYTTDIDATFAQPEIQRWRDFLAALPGPTAPNAQTQKAVVVVGSLIVPASQPGAPAAKPAAAARPAAR